MSFRLTFAAARGELEKAINDINRPIAQAATDAMRDAAEIAKNQGRANIAAAGFSKRWQNALRVDVFPDKGRISLTPAALIYHNIPYADVFESGAQIRGNPKLWLPLKTTPKRIGRKRVTPANVRERGIALNKVKGRDLLAISTRVPKSKATGIVKVTRRMIENARRTGAKSTPAGTGIVRSIPLFHGVSAVNIRKRFSIIQIVNGVRDRLASLYVQNLRD